MRDQRDLLIFHQVALSHSFTKAADVLLVSKGHVSKAISRLEQQLEKKLFQRSTRQLVLTDAGEQLFATTLEMQAALARGLETLQILGDEPRGILRITAPPALAEAILAPAFVAFRQQYPGVMIELNLESRLVDPIAEGYDVVFRSARLEDSNLIARKLMDIESKLVASSSFLKRYDRLKTPQDLTEIPCVAYRAQPKVTWNFKKSNKRMLVDISPVLTSNLLSFLKASVLNGMGVALLPSFMMQEEIKQKRLVAVLPEWELPSAPLYVVYPSRDYMPFKVKCFISFLKSYPFD